MVDCLACPPATAMIRTQHMVFSGQKLQLVLRAQCSQINTQSPVLTAQHLQLRTQSSVLTAQRLRAEYISVKRMFNAGNARHRAQIQGFSESGDM